MAMTLRPLPDEPLFTPKLAAMRLGLSVKNIMDHVEAGNLRYINIGTGKRIIHRFTTYNLQTFLENRKVREQPKCPSTNVPKLKPIAMISNSAAVDFLAIPKPETKKTPTPSSVN
jgi:hypothetical protein